MLKRVLSGLAAALAWGAVAFAAPVDAGHVKLELVAGSQGVAPGQTVQVAVSQDIRKGWHTYWRNAGDSGEPTQAKWTLPAGWSAGEFTWPAPHRMRVGPLVNYGYQDQVLLPVPVTAPASARPGETVTLRAAVSVLVCAEICIPESAVVEIALPVTQGPPPPDPRWGPRIAETLAAAPRPAGLTAVFARKGEGLALAVTGGALAGADLSDAYFFPYDGAVIDHAKPQPVERGPQGLTLTLTPGFAFQTGEGPAKLEGVLSLGERAYEIAAIRGTPPAGAAGLGPPPAKPSGGPAVGMGLPLAVAFAFLGGLILNLMPCVFPILAMKAASLAGHGADRPAARRQGLAFGLGVVATFLLLAGLLIGLRAAGSAIGWGFQLQSPPVVAALALLMLAVALNLSGVFEVGSSSLQNAGSGLTARRGAAGAFFTGALAVVVAAPCTAPFMAPALGWALTLEPVWALVVFLGLALGFAAPFTAIAFIPGSLSWLPRPGPWMDLFKKALAFPMYAAAGWLVWVLTLQAGAAALARILAAAVVIAVAAWLLGIAQARAAQGRRGLSAGVAAAMLAAVTLAAVIFPAYGEAASSANSPPQGAAIASEPYSPERLAALRGEGKAVFVNYTAAWCVSCQVNERLAISTPRTAKAFADNDVTYLKADWTRKDAVIAAELARYGRAGVPLYLVYGAGGRPEVILPSILTEGMVVKALDAAARS